MQDNNETSIREPTVQRAEQDGELARLEHVIPQRGSYGTAGSPQGINYYGEILPQAPSLCQQKQKNGGWSEVHPPLPQEV